MPRKSRKNSRSRSLRKTSMIRRRSGSRRKSQGGSRSRDCSPVSRRKVCGPRRSCKYPRAWSRRELIRYSRNKDIRRKDRKRIPGMDKTQLCSLLGLASFDDVSRYRVIGGRLCGADRSRYNDAWSMKELVPLAKEMGVAYSSKDKFRLCEDISKAQKAANISSQDIELPFRERELAEDIFYVGSPKFIAPFVYYLKRKHDNADFYISEKFSDDFYLGIEYDCVTNAVVIKEDLVKQIRDGRKRFFVVYTRLDNKGTGHVNTLFYDREEGTVTLYEPLGKYKKCDKKRFEDFIAGFFKVYFKAKFVPSSSVCPKLGPQKLAAQQRKQHGLRPNLERHGLCAVFNMLTIDLRLGNPGLTLAEVVAKLLKEMSNMEYSMERYIYVYIDNVLEYKTMFRDEAKRRGVNYYKLIYDSCLGSEIKA